MLVTASAHIDGFVEPGFESVRDAFADNFARRGELGGACAAYWRGRKIVDLWGGIRNKATGEPWDADTMVLVYSATKGLAAMTLALAHSRGWLDYDARVAEYWPEFAQHGKDRLTVRQPRVLRRRTDAPDRPAATHDRIGLSGRDRQSPRARHVHPPS